MVNRKNLRRMCKTLGFRKSRWNKKGFLRIIEATIAIMIVVGVMLVIVSQKEQSVTRDLTEILPPYLDEVAQDPEKRQEISERYDTGKNYTSAENAFILEEIEDFLGERITNPTYEYRIRICDLDKVCPLVPYPGVDEEVFAAERAVSATLGATEYSPKKLKIFLWRKL